MRGFFSFIRFHFFETPSIIHKKNGVSDAVFLTTKSIRRRYAAGGKNHAKPGYQMLPHADTNPVIDVQAAHD